MGVRDTLRAASARRRGISVVDGVPTPEPSLGLAGAITLDTLMTLPMGLLSSTGSADHYARASAELDEAIAFYDRAGWLDDHTLRHPAPDGGARRLDRLRCAAGSRSSRSTAAGTRSTANPAANGGDRSPPTASCPFG